jgi:hypothetical protein
VTTIPLAPVACFFSGVKSISVNDRQFLVMGLGSYRRFLSTVLIDNIIQRNINLELQVHWQEMLSPWSQLWVGQLTDQLD